MIQWDEWRGSMDGRPTLWEKHLFCRKGRHVDLHKMVGTDDPGCFHTHPAFAVRIVFWGGYLEEKEDGRRRRWFPGMIGIVRPSDCHRVARLLNGQVSYSFWVRFRKSAPVQLRGAGWKWQNQKYRDPNVINAWEPE